MKKSKLRIETGGEPDSFETITGKDIISLTEFKYFVSKITEPHRPVMIEVE